MTADWNVLIVRMKEQKEGLEAMLELARRQLEAVQDESFPGNIEDFQRLVVQRQELMRRLEDLQAEIARLEKEQAVALGVEEFTLKAIEGRIPDQQYAEISLRLAELGDVLSRINRVDEELETAALGKLKAGGPASGRALRSQQAVQAYRESLKKQGTPDTGEK